MAPPGFDPPSPDGRATLEEAWMKGTTGAFALLSMLLALGLTSACATERAAGEAP